MSLSLSLKVVEDLDSVGRSNELHCLSSSGNGIPNAVANDDCALRRHLLAFPLRVLPRRDWEHHRLTHPKLSSPLEVFHQFSQTLQCVTSCVRTHSSLWAESILSA